MIMYHLKQVPTDAQIKKFLRRTVFGRNIFCPKCKSWNIVRFEKRYRCRQCQIKFSLFSHTWLCNVKIPLQRFWLILWCWTKQMPVKQTEDLTSLSEKGVRHYFDLFREQLPRDQRLLEHIVQLDEAYFGRFGNTALLMGKERGTRKLAYQILSSDAPAKKDAIDFVRTYVKPESQLNTDGSTIYKNIDKYYPLFHMTDIHKKFEFTNTSEIEGMFGVLRTFIRRMYHHVSEEKLEEYVCEFYCRFSRPEMFKSPYHYLQNTLHALPTG